MSPEITGGLFAIVVALIGILSAVYISRRNARREAGRKLIEVFNDMKASINNDVWTDSNKLQCYLKEYFSKLKFQVDNFRVHLNCNRIADFDRAWINYYNCDGDSRCECYHHYMAFVSNPRAIEIFDRNVQAILSFADPK